eukprot:Unigene6047_Nuclearia_a/m.18536 Unigene6047_Nuclearia_a/g.18536  ORF Unigene6047_Nuclearia_a/g.18536 Unigene6047_Nuclearia_a/m.18536 type:complete len:273 (-) Unigene6047_Nuclearia_a:45-863(-)
MLVVYVLLRRRVIGAHNVRFIAAALSLFDLGIDTVFVITLAGVPDVERWVLYCAIAVFALPVAINLAVLAWALYSEVLTSEAFSQWLQKHATVGAAVTLLACKSAESLFLLDSSILNLAALQAPLSPAIKQRVRTLAFASTFFEALPQLALQVYVAIVLGWDLVTTLSVVSGALMLLFGVLRRSMILLAHRWRGPSGGKHDARASFYSDAVSGNDAFTIESYFNAEALSANMLRPASRVSLPMSEFSTTERRVSNSSAGTRVSRASGAAFAI